MAVRADGEMVGSVSGGCVEGAVVQEAIDLLGGGKPRLLQFGVSDETAWEVGLACGGSIEIFLQILQPEWVGSIVQGYADRKALAMAIILTGSEERIGRTALTDGQSVLAGDWDAELFEAGHELLHEAITSRKTGRYELELEGDALELFIDVLLPSPTLIMIGGVHISVALSRMANTLDYRSVVIDPRKSFASPDRFPDVDELIQRWPQEGLEGAGIDASTAIAVLTHDPKIDDPALLIALRSPAFYVGALGSRATHIKRVERLREAGLTDEELARLRAPIGLDLGGRTPEEIALAILAEITAERYGRP
jgi:xanthine dehydrogenase accessory factor